ncbi:hypothetical protein V496_08760 [Pseudogymnoascus sp. VKM F-4515 (FW-2607)]|nr:hypothetical protein V496_08760 [Pseudogymnoascus sp. VKM F-4515 (FW-2607)]
MGSLPRLRSRQRHSTPQPLSLPRDARRVLRARNIRDALLVDFQRALGDHADGLHGVELVPGPGDLGAAVGDGGDFGGGAGFDAGVGEGEGGEGEGEEGEEGGELHCGGGWWW